MRTLAYRRAEKELGFVAVCLIGYADRVPRFLGDNRGGQAVWIGVTADPKSAHKSADHRQPYHEVKVLEYTWVRSMAHATRLKTELDKALLGNDEDATRLRYSWRELECDPDMVGMHWDLLVASAVRTIEARGEVVEFLEDRARGLRILAHMKGRARRP